MTSEADSTETQALIQRLLAPSRTQSLDFFMILSLCGINLHDTVAEIGCGPGFFTLPLAKYLVTGKLYALDIDEEMLEACRNRLVEARMGNVEILKCQEFDFPLDQESVNGAFLAFVIQQSSDKTRFMRAVRELIRPRGWCTVLEWYRIETEEGPPLERRIDPAEMETIAEESGFRHLSWRDINGEQYMTLLRKL